ncbi:hypothetical protein F4777DRAFT_53129 [Nemania sp. FL0916]|nr:hypothetical protein F4777DRAFT_53129 [Nemania sp. FL0916]
MAITVEATIAIIGVIVSFPTFLAIIWGWAKYRWGRVPRGESKRLYLIAVIVQLFSLRLIISLYKDTHAVELGTPNSIHPISPPHRAPTSISITLDYGPRRAIQLDASARSTADRMAIIDCIRPPDPVRRVP